MYSQTCRKRSPLGQKKDRRPLKRGSIHMRFSMTGQEKCDLLIRVTVNRDDCMDRFDYICISVK